MINRKILLYGVGGQGVILASKIIAWIALELGKDVKMSEIHGMAQRGGTVTTQICIADKVHSPVIEPGEADVLLAFEMLEAKRGLHFLKKDGLLVVNEQRLMPMSVVTGTAVYPDDIMASLKEHTTNLHQVPALQEAIKLNNPRVTNVVLLGTLSAMWDDIPDDLWDKALVANIPRHLELNQKAFSIGKTLA
jgi:indolepyruvate ferredoxin oxidoreductase beta subunit